jgi:hypothetical protein
MASLKVPYVLMYSIELVNPVTGLCIFNSSKVEPNQYMVTCLYTLHIQYAIACHDHMST